MSNPLFDPYAVLVDKLGRPTEIFYSWLVGASSSAPTTVANLPMTNLRGGDRRFVTDCSTTTFNSTATGGGSNRVPVFYDAATTATWRVG